MADKNFIVKNGLTVGSTERISSAGVITGTAATQSVGNSSTALATTAYVRGEIDALIDSAPGTLNTLDELAAAINDDAQFNTTLTDAVALKAPLASPTFTGTVNGAAIAITGDLDIADTGAGAITVGGTTNTYSAPVVINATDLGLAVSDGTKTVAMWGTHGGSSHAGSALGTRSNHDLALITNDTKRMVFDTSGNVGIGITTPNEGGFGSTSSVLSVAGTAQDAFGVLELISTDVTSSNRIGEIRFGNLDAGSSFASNAGMRATRDGADNSSALSLWTTDAGTFTRAMSIDSKQRVKAAKSAMIEQTTLTSASTVDWDADAYGNAYLLLGHNVTIDEPDNPTEGQVISVEIAQGGTAYTVSWHTSFEFAASTAPTMTATANKTDIFTFRYNGSVWQEIGRVQNMAQT